MMLRNTANYLISEGAKWYKKSHGCLKLSNSGNALKLLVPSCIQKDTNGWNNSSCKVISLKIIIYTLKSPADLIPEPKTKQTNKSVSKIINNLQKETSIGNLGSKLVVLKPKITIKKEQRIDGSWRDDKIHHICLRFILMGFEKNYRNRIFSKQINIQTSRLYSSKVLKQCVLCRHDNLEMNPWFLTGFTDAEGCFTIGVVKNKKYKVGWTVKLRFQLGVNEKDKFLLLQSKNFFGVGNIYVSESAVQFIVQSVNDLAVIIKHFDKFSLITKKR